MARTLLAIAALALIAASCGPGPLPEIPPRHPDYKADWFPTQSEDRLPLDVAIYSGRLDDVRALLRRGADPNARWGQSGDRFPLQDVFNSGGNPVTDPTETVRLLLQHGADPNAKWCPFESRGPSEWTPSCESATGSTALMIAAMAGRADIVEPLLQAGADASPRDWLGGSALDYAYDEIVFELISRSLFPDLATRDLKALQWLNGYPAEWFGLGPGSTPLSRAITEADGGYVPPPPPPPNATVATYRAYEKRTLGRVRTLLRIGANPNERANRDRTPLPVALQSRALRTARVLLQNGADVNQRWCERYLASWAVHRNSPAHLVEGGKDPACTPLNGITPLMWTAAVGDREAVKLLLEFKADRSLRDWAGRSVLHYATTREVWDLLERRPSRDHP